MHILYVCLYVCISGDVTTALISLYEGQKLAMDNAWPLLHSTYVIIK